MTKLLIILCAVMLVIATGVWYRILRPGENMAAPLSYSAAEYPALCADSLAPCDVFNPGGIVRWQSHLAVPARATLTSNYSVWYETCNRVAAVARIETQAQIDIMPTEDFVILNTYVIPQAALPGQYRVTRFTTGMNTERAFYDVRYTVAGEPPVCP